MQSGVKLQIFGYCLHPLPDPVADDEEEEAPTPEVCGKRIVELPFVDLGVNRPHHIEQRVAVALEAMAHLALHIGRRPPAEFHCGLVGRPTQQPDRPHARLIGLLGSSRSHVTTPSG